MSLVLEFYVLRLKKYLNLISSQTNVVKEVHKQVNLPIMFLFMLPVNMENSFDNVWSHLEQCHKLPQ